MHVYVNPYKPINIYYSHIPTHLYNLECALNQTELPL